jgi:hypothetical protein
MRLLGFLFDNGMNLRTTALTQHSEILTEPHVIKAEILERALNDCFPLNTSIYTVRLTKVTNYLLIMKLGGLFLCTMSA